MNQTFTSAIAAHRAHLADMRHARVSRELVSKLRQRAQRNQTKPMHLAAEAA